nr:MAG TPA: hypothetical protein [Caudoviricetes sp.]
MWYPYGCHRSRRIQDVHRQTEIHPRGRKAEGRSTSGEGKYP